mmetsp:Transcript_26466/g.83883  ORF Transcript_26466/g.83883 Transcript_26466/m.83883 type:complete len:207 (+) Transcript_26466:676-1296(+)
MQRMRLPIDVEEPNFTVPAAPGSLVPPGRKVRLRAAVDLDLVEPNIHLRRRRLNYDPSCLPDVLRAVRDRRLPPVDLEASRHVSSEASGEVEADEKGHRLLCLLEVDVPFPVFLCLLVRVVPSPTVELSYLEVALGVALLRQYAPHVKVCQACLRVDGCFEPPVQAPCGTVPQATARTATPRGAHPLISRILVPPAEDVSEIVRGT